MAGCARHDLGIADLQQNPERRRVEQRRQRGPHRSAHLSQPRTKLHLVAQTDHLGMHADRELVDERMAIGAGDVDRHDLACRQTPARRRRATAGCPARGRTGSSFRPAGSPAPSSCPSACRPRPRRCRRRRRPARHRHGLPRPWRARPRCPCRPRARCRRDGRPSQAFRSSCSQNASRSVVRSVPPSRLRTAMKRMNLVLPAAKEGEERNENKRLRGREGSGCASLECSLCASVKTTGTTCGSRRCETVGPRPAFPAKSGLARPCTAILHKEKVT